MAGEGKWYTLSPATSESTCASCGRGQFIDWPERHPLHPCDDHLGDAHAPHHLELLPTEIHQRHHQLAPVVAVDCSRRVRQADSVTKCQAGPRPELAFIPFRYGNAEAGPEQLPLERCQFPVLGACQIVACRPRGGRAWQGKPLSVGKAGDPDLDRSLWLEALRQRF